MDQGNTWKTTEVLTYMTHINIWISSRRVPSFSFYREFIRFSFCSFFSNFFFSFFSFHFFFLLHHSMFWKDIRIHIHVCQWVTWKRFCDNGINVTGSNVSRAKYWLSSYNSFMCAHFLCNGIFVSKVMLFELNHLNQWRTTWLKSQTEQTLATEEVANCKGANDSNWNLIIYDGKTVQIIFIVSLSSKPECIYQRKFFFRSSSLINFKRIPVGDKIKYRAKLDCCWHGWIRSIRVKISSHFAVTLTLNKPLWTNEMNDWIETMPSSSLSIRYSFDYGRGTFDGHLPPSR